MKKCFAGVWGREIDACARGSLSVEVVQKYELLQFRHLLQMIQEFGNAYKNLDVLIDESLTLKLHKVTW